MKPLSVFLVLLALAAPAHACDWLAPSGKTSQWVEGKIIFWGRPVETRWLKKRPDVPNDGNIVTRFEVLETLEGNLNGHVEVIYSSIGSTSCGITIPVGEADIFVIIRSENGKYYTGPSINRAVSNILLHAYFQDETDFSVDDLGVHYPQLGYPKGCNSQGESSVPDLCKEGGAYDVATQSFFDKQRKMNLSGFAPHDPYENSDIPKAKRRWWQKLWPFD